jgi:hypothetical protein
MPNHSYNSVIYASIGTNNYFVFLVNQTFVERYENVSSPEVLLIGSDDGNWVPVYEPPRDLVLRQLQESALAGKLDKLDNKDCIQSYGKMYLSDRSNLLLVGSAFPLTINDTAFISSIYVFNEAIDNPQLSRCALDPVPWICPRHDCEVACVNRLNEVEPQNWTVTEVEAVGFVGSVESMEFGSVESARSAKSVDYCLSQPTEESCKLQFSLPIVMVIIFFNVFKVAIMLILAFGLREARVQTIGDAIASFLIQPDHIVNGRCLYNASDFKRAGLSGHPHDLIFTNKSMRFAETGEKRVWLLTYIL